MVIHVADRARIRSQPPTLAGVATTLSIVAIPISALTFPLDDRLVGLHMRRARRSRPRVRFDRDLVTQLYRPRQLADEIAGSPLNG